MRVLDLTSMNRFVDAKVRWKGPTTTTTGAVAETPKHPRRQKNLLAKFEGVSNMSPMKDPALLRPVVGVKVPLDQFLKKFLGGCQIWSNLIEVVAAGFSVTSVTPVVAREQNSRPRLLFCPFQIQIGLQSTGTCSCTVACMSLAIKIDIAMIIIMMMLIPSYEFNRVIKY